MRAGEHQHGKIQQLNVATATRKSILWFVSRYCTQSRVFYCLPTPNGIIFFFELELVQYYLISTMSQDKFALFASYFLAPALYLKKQVILFAKQILKQSHLNCTAGYLNKEFYCPVFLLVIFLGR